MSAAPALPFSREIIPNFREVEEVYRASRKMGVWDESQIWRGARGAGRTNPPGLGAYKPPGPGGASGLE